MDLMIYLQHLIINLDLEVNYKKNTISLILERNEVKNEDLIKSLYEIANKYIKEKSQENSPKKP